MINLYLLISFLLLLSSLLIITINNPIYKILYLILIFFFSSSIFLILDFYFIGLTYFIVYIGAITILFLFIIMMLELNSFSSFSFKYFFIFSIGFFPLIGPFDIEFLKNPIIYNYLINDWFILYKSYTDIEFLGFFIFIHYPYSIIIISFLLWLILIGILSIIHN